MRLNKEFPYQAFSTQAGHWGVLFKYMSILVVSFTFTLMVGLWWRVSKRTCFFQAVTQYMVGASLWPHIQHFDEMDTLSDSGRIQPSSADARLLWMQTRHKVKVAVDTDPSESLYICNCYNKSIIDIPPYSLSLSMYMSTRSYHS